MDIFEAIKNLEKMKDLFAGKAGEAMDMAISSMQDLLEYREFGTVRELKYKIPHYAICKKLVEKYSEIGTIEECREAVETKRKYETQWIDDMNNPLEPLKLASALQSEILKLELRKTRDPKKVSILDYTIIYALKDCLDRYSEGEQDEQI